MATTFVSERAIARELGVGRKLARNVIRSGAIRSWKMPGAKWRKFSLEDAKAVREAAQSQPAAFLGRRENDCNA